MTLPRPCDPPCDDPRRVIVTVTLRAPMGNGLVRSVVLQAPLAGLDTAEGQADILACLSDAMVMMTRDIAHTMHGVQGSA